jgi:hypothetical protein
MSTVMVMVTGNEVPAIPLFVMVLVVRTKAAARKEIAVPRVGLSSRRWVG